VGEILRERSKILDYAKRAGVANDRDKLVRWLEK
jgi:hypothetical protein